MRNFLLIALALILVATPAIAKDKVAAKAGTLAALDCSGAIPIDCNSSVSGSNIGLPNNVTAYSCVGWNEAAGEAIYELVLDGEYVVEAGLSGLAADLDIFFLDGCDENACLAYGNTLFTTTVGAGTYYIVIDGFNDAEDFFALTVSCNAVAPPAPLLAGGETCADAVDIQDGSLATFSVDLPNYTDDYDSDCFSWNLPGGDAVFKADLTAGETFTVTMDGPCDMAMYIFGDCTLEEALACSDNCCSGAQEAITFTPAYTGTYYLVLDTFQAAGCDVIVNIDAPVSVQEANWGDIKAMFR